jgi:hypothetical protein
MLEMLATLIAGILGLIKKGDLQQASHALENAYMDLLKNDASLFREIPGEELTSSLLSMHNYTHDHLKVLSELFYAEGELQLARGNEENGREYYEKSLILLQFVVREARAYSLEDQSRLAQIQNRIADLKTPRS